MILDTSQHYDTPTLAIAFNVWVDIHAPMDVVFHFLTDERELSRWWCSAATTEPRAGGKLHFVWRGEQEITGDALFTSFQYPNQVTIEWTHHNGQPIVCDGDGSRGFQWMPLNIYELAMINGNTTRVHLHDMGLSGHARFASMVQSTAQGWRDAMGRLKKTVEARQREELNLKVRAYKRPERAPERAPEE